MTSTYSLLFPHILSNIFISSLTRCPVLSPIIGFKSFNIYIFFLLGACTLIIYSMQKRFASDMHENLPQKKNSSSVFMNLSHQVNYIYIYICSNHRVQRTYRSIMCSAGTWIYQVWWGPNTTSHHHHPCTSGREIRRIYIYI